MKGRTFIGLVFIVAVLGMAIPAWADTHAPWPADWNNWSDPNLMVPVGNPGNAADTRYDTNGYGSVSYEYKIGKYEVTVGQYAEFLNRVAASDTYALYDTEMSYYSGIARSGSSGSYAYSVDPNFANRPVNYVGFWDACRFANWLNNGQPTGAQDANTTERGTYTLDGYNGTDGRTIHRNPDAKWAVTNEDEWYKAAYYDPTLNGGSGGYWDYPTNSDAAPGQDMNDVSGNNANYLTAPYTWPIDSGHYTTVAGEFENSVSPYGTFDQGGNVWEWNEAIPYQDQGYSPRGLRGGAFADDYGGDGLFASNRIDGGPAYGVANTGFRVVEVPEPGSMAILALGGIGFLRRGSGQVLRRRRGLSR